MVLAFGICSLLNVCIAQTETSGCRALSEQIWYDANPPRDPSSARIVTVELNDGRSVLVTAGKDGFYGTSDLGKNWTLLVGGKWTLWQRFPNVILAPSDPSTRYRYEPIGVIKRSQDGGATWSEQRPRIEGRSAGDIALRVSSEHDYVLEFDISAVH